MSNIAKPFDAVRTMREIRDSLSHETAKMGYEEQKRYMREKSRQSQVKDRQAKLWPTPPA